MSSRSKTLCLKPTTFGIFLFNQAFNGFLCLRPNYSAGNKWSIPKGRPNEKEEPFDTAKREMFEETGILYSDLYVLEEEFIGEYTYASSTAKRLAAWFIRIDNPSITVKLDQENKEFGWFPFNKAERILHEAQVRALYAIKSNKV